MSEQKIGIVLRGTKGQIRVKALLDSGATVSIVDKKTADRIGMQSYGIGNGEGVDGRNVRGIKSMAKVGMGGGWIAANFVILDNVPDRVILGVDFIQQADLEIDWKTERVKIPEIYKRKRFRI